MGSWKEKADDMVIIYILLLAAIFIIIGASLAPYTFGCSAIIAAPGALILWAALRKEVWLKRGPWKKYKRDHPYAPYPPPRFTEPEEDYYKLTKRLYRKLNVPSFQTLLIIFLVAIGAASLILLSIETWLSYFAWAPLLLLFIIAFSFPSIMWISFVYSKDNLTPEPARNVMIALSWGMLSVIPAGFLNGFFHWYFTIFGFSAIVALVLTAAFSAPFVEESLKPLGLHAISHDINTRFDGLVYGVTAGMGFAMVENLSYEIPALIAPFAEQFLDLGFYDNVALEASSGFAYITLARGLGSTVGHAVGAGMIGMAFYRFKSNPERPLFPLISAFAFAVTLHMAWNGSLGILELLNAPEIVQLPVMIGLVVVDLSILMYLIRICRADTEHEQVPLDDKDLYRLPPPPSPYYYTAPPPPSPAYSMGPPPPPGPVTQPPSRVAQYGRTSMIIDTRPPPQPRSPPPPRSMDHLPETYPNFAYPPQALPYDPKRQKTVRCPHCRKDSITPPPEYGKYMVCPHCHKTFQHPF